jgi:hypothetical protein
MEVALTPEVEEHAASRRGGGSTPGLVEGACPAGGLEAEGGFDVDGEHAAARNPASDAPRITWRPIIDTIP